MGDNEGARKTGWRLPLRLLQSSSHIAFATRNRLLYCALALAAAFVAFYGLADYGILDGNESLYVEMAREMASTREWALPTLDGLPYLEKPPLMIWLLVAGKALGTSVEFSSRLVSAVSAVFLVAAVARFSSLLDCERKGIVAAGMLTTSLGVWLMSHVAMPDMLLTAFFAPACLAFLLGVLEGDVRSGRFAAGLLAAASLTKGLLPIALFMLVAAVAYWLEKPWRVPIRRLARDPVAWVVLAAPISLWLWAVESKLPGAAAYFVIDEHVLRFLGRREPHDYYGGSPFYYLPRLFLFFFPWAGVLLFGWLAKSSSIAGRRQVRRFLWLCAGIPFCFFSASSAKANYYVLLCLPPLAILAADYLTELLRRRSDALLLAAMALPGAMLAVVLVVGLGSRAGPGAAFLVPLLSEECYGAALVALALAFAALLLVSLGWRRLALVCFGSLVVPLSLGFHVLAAQAEPVFSQRLLADLIRSRYGDALPVFLFEDFEALASLAVYLEKDLPVIDSRSNDLYFGRTRIPDHPNFVEAGAVPAGSGEALVVVLGNRRRDFAASDLAGRAVAVATVGRATLYRVHR